MRLFVGLPVPPSPRYAEVTRDLLDAVGPREGRAVPDGTWHVTLRFLGDVDDPGPARDALADALDGAGAGPLPVRVAGVGAFRDARHARVAWAGVEAPGLEALANRVVAATAHLGQPPEKRDFRPHVTLARLRRPRNVSTWAAHHRDTVFAEGVLDRLVLYRSVLGPEGARHEEEAVFPLAEP